MSSSPKAQRNRPLRSGRFLLDTRRAARRGFLSKIHVGEALTWKRILVICGLLAIVLLPSVFGPRVLPYRLQQVLRHPVFARVDFTWKNADEVGRLERRVQETFARYYREDSQWVYRVFDPVYNLLNEAYLLATEKDLKLHEAQAKLLAYAKEKKISAEEAECLVLVRELRNRGRRMDFYEDLIKPARGEILKRSFSAGILSFKDYKRELQKPITIMSAYWDEPSQPVGSPNGPISIQLVPRLLQAYMDVELSRFAPEFRKAYAGILSRHIFPSLTYDGERTEQELLREITRQTGEMERIEQGRVVMEVGRPITRVDLDRLRAEADTYERSRGRLAMIFRLIGMAALLFIASVGFLLYLERFERGVFHRAHHLASVLLLGAVLLAMIQLGMSSAEFRLTLVPLGIVAGISAIAFGPRVGVGTASVLAFAGFITTEVDVGEVIALLGSAWIFCCLAPGVRHRTGLLRAGLVAGAVSFLGINFWRMAGGIPLVFSSHAMEWWNIELWTGAWSFVFWVVGSMVLTAALSYVEKFFGAATNVTLLELSDQEHPCLRRLVLDAPGTYHHSVVVGNLAEAAAEAIGGNPLLARVGSYYHDIGKVIKPEYFTENDRGNSPHDSLSPTLSTLIITSHVKDGVEMGRAYRLPQAIIDIIEQHHGDTSVRFFFEKARQAEGGEGLPESAFSYPGPRPRSREAAIVSLADTVEAASRSLTEPTSSHIERLVHRLVMDKVMMGQFDESPLTFRDIGTIERSFVRTLNAMHHSRVRYPDQRSRKERRG
ncbi:MAG: HD family phosphohydrolase [Planctomycetota bacterium]|jgi:putative nucleotidyltransferase with HDIG domain